MLGSAPDKLFAVGGGIKNTVWSQATSDVAGMPQTIRKNSFGASYGDAFLAAFALGIVKLDDIEAWNPAIGQIVPEQSVGTLYSKRLEQFKALYENNKDLMRDLG